MTVVAFEYEVQRGDKPIVLDVMCDYDYRPARGYDPEEETFEILHVKKGDKHVDIDTIARFRGVLVQDIEDDILALTMEELERLAPDPDQRLDEIRDEGW